MRIRNKLLVALIGMAVFIFAFATLPDVRASDPPAKRSYVGSDSCKTCHAKTYKQYNRTAHANYIHGVKKNDLKGMPVDGKVKSIGNPATVQFMLDRKGPKLMLTLYELGNGSKTATFEIWGTQGGNGVAGKVRLLIRQDETTLISPVQWNHNEQTRTGDDKFSAYHPEHWYNNDGTLIPTADTVTAPATFAKSQYANSWERRCMGCHTTGTKLKYFPASGRFVDESTETNIGCEACHGPGSEHAAGPAKTNIINPATQEKQRGMDICARCHIRGDSVDKGKAKFTLGWPAWVKKAKVRLYWQAGGKNALADMYVGGEGKWDGNDKKWRKFASHYNNSTKHHQQGFDYIQSTKWGAMPWQNVKCWECHNPHSNGVKGTAQLLKSVDDNKLCLDCHASYGFEDEGAILAHTGHLTVESPTCVDCHMPLTTKSQAWWTKFGGDIHSHTFEAIDPNLTKLMAKKNKGTIEDGKAIANSCYSSECHSDDTDYGAARWNTWMKNK